MRGLRSVFAATALALGCTGCARQVSAPAPSTRPIRDMVGNLVTIPTPENIHRAAVVHTPIVQVARVVGADRRLCAVTTQVKLRPLISRFDTHLKSVSMPVAGCEVNIEELIASRPDVCIGSRRSSCSTNPPPTST